MFDVTIAGEINLDLILYGLAEQMPVDRELLANDFRLTLGSSSAILAHNLSVLGAKVGFVTRVGSDPLGEIALERLRVAGVDVSRTTFASGSQTGVTLLLHHGATRHILTYLGTMAEMTVSDVDVDFVADSRHFHVSSLFLQKGLQAGLPALCRELSGKGLTISLDTNDDPEDRWGAPLDEMLDCVDVLLPNEDEAKRMAQTEDLDEAIARLAKRVSIVAVKCGGRGSIVQAGEQRWSVPPPQVVPVDTIGAGDSYNAGFLKGYLAKKPLAECAAMGNFAAAFSTLRPGGTESYRDAELMQSFFAAHTETALLD
ncbi:carbohydrate kinase family protein [Terriglobus saanensis]|uniref:PfkB domain protein n=1 Tax=Terriglobus saanensis (strain ATCC BAA-1853 / DSM 23119 / SP1PR4) TaxID=401053 RepID=E8V0X4_TERSS|nr:carbohydrate kinase family protein [Terriglobus saanensis]ADV82265.1 PfkB domain protein [Terriglobus saanensis SP1PR4]